MKVRNLHVQFDVLVLILGIVFGTHRYSVNIFWMTEYQQQCLMDVFVWSVGNHNHFCSYTCKCVDICGCFECVCILGEVGLAFSSRSLCAPLGFGSDYKAGGLLEVTTRNLFAQRSMEPPGKELTLQDQQRNLRQCKLLRGQKGEAILCV